MENTTPISIAKSRRSPPNILVLLGSAVVWTIVTYAAIKISVRTLTPNQTFVVYLVLGLCGVLWCGYLLSRFSVKAVGPIVFLFLLTVILGMSVFRSYLLLVVAGVGGAVYLWIKFPRNAIAPVGIFSLLIIFQCGGGFAMLLFTPSERAMRSSCSTNLHVLGHVFEGYFKVHQAMPPAYKTSPSGTPLYSWRVMLLPYMEEQYLYKEFHLDEPWDSPHNAPLSAKQLLIFQCRHIRGWKRTQNFASYVAVVGPDTAWPGAVGRPLADFTDGLDKTILLLEVAALDIPWAKPQNLEFDHFAMPFNASTHDGPSSRHLKPYIAALFADGKVHLLDPKISLETLKALLTVNGGEDVEIPLLQEPHDGS